MLREGSSVPGVLCALPCLVESGLFRISRKLYGEIGPAFYGLPYDVDALVDYQIEPEDPTRAIPNPERRALDKQIRAARVDLAKLERE